MHCSALFAPTQRFVGIEAFKNWRQIANDILQTYLGPIHQVMTLRAIPLEAIQRTLGPRHLDHHADRIRSTLR